MEVFEPLYSNLWKFILSINKDRDAAKDILSETILIAYEKFETLKNERAFLSFLFTIASRLNNAVRKSKTRFEFKESHLLDDFRINALNPEESTDIGIMYGLLEQIPEKQKESLMLHEVFGFSRNEIAAMQNTNLTNVKIRLYRGRKALEKLLKAGQYE